MPANAAEPLAAESDAAAAMQQAHQALNAQQLDQAELLLERVLMLKPEHAEARLELAILLARRGRAETALSLIQSLIEDPRTDAAYRRKLTQLLTDLKARDVLTPSQAMANSSPVPTPLYSTEFSWGASSNPLMYTGIGEVTVTLPDGLVTLPLATKARSGSVVGASIGRRLERSGVDISVQQFSLPDTATNLRALIWAELPAPIAEGGLQWYVQAQRGFDRIHRYTAGLSLPWGQQRASLAIYREPEQDDKGAILRYDYRWRGWLGADWFASLERATSTTAMQGYWREMLAVDFQLDAARKIQTQLVAQQDLNGYSALLAHDARRRLLTRYVAYEQQIATGQGGGWLLRAYVGARQSNLELFTYGDRGVQVVWQQQWH